MTQEPTIASTWPGDRTSGAPALAASGVSKTYGGTRALHEVSLSVRAGTIHALMGGNGSGKSTLIKVLAGVVAADNGQLFMSGAWSDAGVHSPGRAKAAGLHFVHQQNSTFPDLTVAENLALGRGFERTRLGTIAWGAQRERARQVLRRFEIDVSPEAALARLSAASQMMVAIARALQDQDEAGDAGVLVLDEPTASLPRHEVDVLLEALRRYASTGQTIIYVSHRLEEVVAIADEVTILRNGHVARVLERDQITHPALVEGITGARPSAKRASGPSRRRSGVKEPVLSARTSEGHHSFQLFAGEIIGVAGLLGSGRSRLLKQIFGVVPRPGLTVEIDGVALGPSDVREAMRRGIAFVPESRLVEAAFPDLTVAENLSVAHLDKYSTLGYVPASGEARSAQRLVTNFGIRTPSLKAPMTALSGGNQQKVILARWLQRGPRVLLLDEPTQGVDIGARAEIYELIQTAAQTGTTVLVASSDFEELAQVSHDAIVVSNGRVTSRIDGPLTHDQLNHSVYQQEMSG